MVCVNLFHVFGWFGFRWFDLFLGLALFVLIFLVAHELCWLDVSRGFAGLVGLVGLVGWLAFGLFCFVCPVWFAWFDWFVCHFLVCLCYLGCSVVVWFFWLVVLFGLLGCSG